MNQRLMLLLIRDAGRVSSEKGNSEEMTMKLYLGIEHNRTTRKKGNLEGTQKTERYIVRV